jgi:hypothetical protein
LAQEVQAAVWVIQAVLVLDHHLLVRQQQAVALVVPVGEQLHKMEAQEVQAVVVVLMIYQHKKLVVQLQPGKVTQAAMVDLTH